MKHAHVKLVPQVAAAVTVVADAAVVAAATAAAVVVAATAAAAVAATVVVAAAAVVVMAADAVADAAGSRTLKFNRKASGESQALFLWPNRVEQISAEGTTQFAGQLR